MSKVDTNIYLALLFVFAVIICFYEHMAIIPLLLILGAVYYYAQKNKDGKDIYLSGYWDNIIRNIERTNYYAVGKLDVGMAVFSKEGKLQWHNELFAEMVDNKELGAAKPEEILPLQENAFEILSVKDGEKVIQLEKTGRYYKMRYCSVKTQERVEIKDGESKGLSGLMLFLTDITEHEILRQQYENNRLCLAYVCFDNYEEVTRGLSETSIATLTGEVNGMLTKWVSEQHGFICRMNKEKCLVGFNQSSVQDLQDNRFDILDKIRELRIGNKIRPTVSIGMSCDGENLEELRLNSDRALNMALGRGGDQAVVIKDKVIQYFGGTSEVTTKSTRVRARMVAQTIKENMLKADRVFIMGHRDEDFDAIGSAIGVAKLALSVGKETFIVRSGINGSMEKIQEVFSDDKLTQTEDKRYIELMINENEALTLATENSLLVLVDHHREMITASPKVLKEIKNKLIIDHHRRAEDIISDTVLQYLEPSASSTCELVTELVGYFNERLELSSGEATAMYAGIVLDTKNFALQTGERTFEAAALLRRSGGNPNLVRLLFKDNMEMVQQRARLIADAKLPYPGLAISIYKKVEKNSQAQVIAAQTADSLVTIDGIQMGVAMIEYNDGSLGISARSDGSVNVQRIMEELGGGGHQTVAGVQLMGKRAKDVEPQIIALAKEQIEESNDNESNSVTRR